MFLNYTNSENYKQQRWIVLLTWRGAWGLKNIMSTLFPRPFAIRWSSQSAMIGTQSAGWFMRWHCRSFLLQMTSNELMFGILETRQIKIQCLYIDYNDVSLCFTNNRGIISDVSTWSIIENYIWWNNGKFPFHHRFINTIIINMDSW